MTNQGNQQQEHGPGNGQRPARLIVFGARGRVGRAVVAQARARGHEVTEAGRADGDVTSAADVARLAAGHDAAVASVYDPAAAPGAFFPAAARALAAGLAEAGVRRLVSVGLASVLPTESGALLMDTPGYPQEWREFYEGHGAGTEALRAAAPEGLDWAVLSPAGDFAGGLADPADLDGLTDLAAGEDPRDGRVRTHARAYAFAAADAGARITHADFARAVLDEALSPTVRAAHAGVTAA